MPVDFDELGTENEDMESAYSSLWRKQLILIGKVCFFASAICLASYWLPSRLAAQDDALQQGLTALSRNQLQLALDHLTAAESERPSDARVRNFRGIVLARLGLDNEAAREYQEAIRINPALEDAYKNLGFLEWTEHDLEDARAHLKRALELAADDSFTHYYLGRVQLDSKIYENAFQELERSGVSWPTDVEFLIEAANGYRALGQRVEARKVANHLSTMPLN